MTSSLAHPRLELLLFFNPGIDAAYFTGVAELAGVVLLQLPSLPLDHRDQALLHLEERRIPLLLQPVVSVTFTLSHFHTFTFTL